LLGQVTNDAMMEGFRRGIALCEELIREGRAAKDSDLRAGDLASLVAERLADTQPSFASTLLEQVSSASANPEQALALSSLGGMLMKAHSAEEASISDPSQIMDDEAAAVPIDAHDVPTAVDTVAAALDILGGRLVQVADTLGANAGLKEPDYQGHHSVCSSQTSEPPVSTCTATPRGTLPLLPPPSAVASKTAIPCSGGHQRPAPTQFPAPSRTAPGSASAGALLESGPAMSSQARSALNATANTSTPSLMSKVCSEDASVYLMSAERFEEWPSTITEVPAQTKQHACTPDRPRGSYIYASGKVYWLNYDDPLDLQRLPAGTAGLACEQDSVTSAPSQDLASSAGSRQVGTSHRERTEHLYGGGSRSRLQTGGSVARCAPRRYGAHPDAASEDSETVDDDASPSPSPPEPLLPETPQPCTRLTGRAEPRVPRLWDSVDTGHYGAPARRSSGSLARTLSTVWQSPAEEPTPRYEGLSTARSMVLIGDHPAGASLRAPMLNSTTPRGSRTQLVRRHLSAPRLHGAAAALTPRSISPGLQRSYLSQGRLQQASVPSQPCAAPQAPLSARVRSLGPTATVLTAASTAAATSSATTGVNTRLTPRKASVPTRRSALLSAHGTASPSPPLGLAPSFLACTTPSAPPATKLMQQSPSPRRHNFLTQGAGAFGDWPSGAILQPWGLS